MSQNLRIAVCVVILMSLTTYVFGQGYQGYSYSYSPLNYENSSANYNNSSLNYSNSPQNYENSSANYNSPNAVFDSKGNRIGYEVVSPAGIVNRFDNAGNRTSYRRTK